MAKGRFAGMTGTGGGGGGGGVVGVGLCVGVGAGNEVVGAAGEDDEDGDAEERAAARTDDAVQPDMPSAGSARRAKAMTANVAGAVEPVMGVRDRGALNKADSPGVESRGTTSR